MTRQNDTMSVVLGGTYHDDPSTILKQYKVDLPLLHMQCIIVLVLSFNPHVLHARCYLCFIINSYSITSLVDEIMSSILTIELAVHFLLLCLSTCVHLACKGLT